MSKAFVLEIGVEELPARHCQSILRQLSDNFIKQLAASFNLQLSNHQLFISPRRIALIASTIEQASSQEEVKGPLFDVAFQDGKPTKIAEKFAQSHDLTPDDLEQRDIKGRTFVFAKKSLAGSFESDIAAFTRKLIESIAIDKPMRWDKTGFRFSRPIRSIVCLVGKKMIPFDFINITSDRKTVGPRFLGSPSISISQAKQYEDTLAKNKIIVDHTKRERLIKEVLKKLHAEHGLVVAIEGDSLLKEVTHLVEYPHPIICSFDTEFLKLPTEIISTVLSDHQRYFPFKDEKTGQMSATFLAIANYDKDSETIKKGNETVVHARLRDAVFFFEQDRRNSLSDFAEKTDTIIFQEKLGSMHDKTERVEKIAMKLAEGLDIPGTQIQEAASLCKADLATQMVAEFSSLEGTVGSLYAELDGLESNIATAIREHYLPRHSNDILPETPLGIVLSLSDTIDTLYGLLSIGLRPKGNSDPYGIRRSAISIVRILWETELLISLDDLISSAASVHNNMDAANEVQDFILSRLEQYLKETIAEKIYPSTDIVRSVIYNSEPILLNKKLVLAAVTKRLVSTEFEQLAELIKRIYNIAIRDKTPKKQTIKTASLNDSEKAFIKEISSLSKKNTLNLDDLYRLIEPGTTFFEKNMVMSDDKTEQENRLEILRQAHEVILRVINPQFLLS